MKDKWRNLIKFQHLRKEEAAKVPYKAAVRAAKGAGKGGDGAVGGGKGGVAAKPGVKAPSAGGKGAGAKKGAGGGAKKTTTVSRDALSKGKGGSDASAAMSAKEKLKATFGRGQDDDEDDDEEYETLGGSAPAVRPTEVRFDPEVDASLAKLKAKRAGMVNEVELAEQELAKMKTAVEQAEAVYSSARARVHEVLVGEQGKDDYDEDDEDGDVHEQDWDKYLHFGEHETDDEEDEEVARAAEAAAEAHAAVIRATTKRPSEKKPSEKKPSVEDDDATDHEGDSDEEVEDPNDSDEEIEEEDEEDLDEEERIARMANAVLAEAGLPPMHEIEHVLLTELKKLEMANAAVVHARLALEAVDAEFAEALVSAHKLAARAQAAAAFDADDDAFDLEDDEELDDEEDFAPAPKAKAKPKPKSAAHNNDSNDAGGGGRVVEDRRYGIYDARRYRSEAENDAEAAAAAKGGRSSTTAAKRKAPSVDAKKSAKAIKTESEFWYEQPKASNASTRPSQASGGRGRGSANSADGLTWRRKRTATRVTIGRPVAGPTSWAAIGQHIIKE